jgi:quercetin dioxygenase-like cupin family protein
MKAFDLTKIKGFPYEKREKNVFYQVKEFKTRIIELPPGGKMPPCKMSEHVIFVVLDGEVTVEVNSEKMRLREKTCLVAEPADLSMHTQKGVRMLGIQIAAASKTGE